MTQRAYEDLPVITQQEALTLIASEIYERVEAECNLPSVVENATAEERIMLAVHTVFDVLENGYGYLPAFNLLPVPSLYHGMRAANVFDVKHCTMEDVRWDGPIVLAGSRADRDPTLTGTFEYVYDSYRDRLTLAAHDLFGTDYIQKRNTMEDEE